MCFFLQTFMTLPLVDVSTRVGLSGAQQAESYIRNMVSCKQRCILPTRVVAATQFLLRLKMEKCMQAWTSREGWCHLLKTQKTMTA